MRLEVLGVVAVLCISSAGCASGLRANIFNASAGDATIKSANNETVLEPRRWRTVKVHPWPPGGWRITGRDGEFRYPRSQVPPDELISSGILGRTMWLRLEPDGTLRLLRPRARSPVDVVQPQPRGYPLRPLAPPRPASIPPQLIHGSGGRSVGADRDLSSTALEVDGSE